MKDFSKKAKSNLIPCAIGGVLGTWIAGGTIMGFIISTAFCVVLFTYVYDKLGWHKEEEG